MPPKAKFTKEGIIASALSIAERGGIEALTARSLGNELGSSARPIFTVFESMEEVQNEVIASAYKIYERYEDEEMDGEHPFKGSGTGYIRFASEHPKLFQMLFMRERYGSPDHGQILPLIDGYYEKIVRSVIDEYGFGENTAKELYMHMWIYSHGIASLIATGVCGFSKEDIQEMLGVVGAGIIGKYKSEGRV